MSEPTTMLTADELMRMEAPGERLAQLGRITGFFPGAPDLCVEVVSPSDTVSRVDAKVAQWIAHGTRVVFVLDPFAQLATIHRRDQKPIVVAHGERLEAPDVLPGWSLPLSDVFSL